MKKTYTIPNLIYVSVFKDIITKSLATDDLAEDYSIGWGEKITY